MKKSKIIQLVIIAILFLLSILLYVNRDNIAYVGPIKYVEVDCDKKREILNNAYDVDQEIRKSGMQLESAKVDSRNQELVISLLEKCGMPTLEEVNQKEMDAIWLILQHTRKKFRKKYFNLIEEAVENGDLSKQQYALMKDRILMGEGKPQIYGSQIVSGKLYKLESPEKVNERREEVGLGPIEEYLQHFNIQYDSN